MTEGMWIAIITVSGTLVLGIGAGARYVISTIIDAYKQQASQTVDAKDAEIARLRDGVTADLKELRREVAELRQDVWSWRRERTS